jgi:hypothetical protein
VLAEYAPEHVGTALAAMMRHLDERR